MAKNNKKPQVEAPIVEEVDEKTPAVRVNVPKMPEGMSQHDKVLYASVIQHRKDEMLRDGGEKAEKYEALTRIEDAVIIDVAVTEVITKRNPVGMILSISESNYNAIKLLALDMDVKLSEYKDLQKPTKEQLAAAGISAAPNQVVLKLEDKNIGKDAKNKKKAELKMIDDANSGKKDYMKDHTKIETDEQLKEALGFQMVNPAIANPIERIITTTQFYRSYLEARAEKSDNPEAELAKIHKSSLANLLQDIITMVPPTFITSVFGQRLGRLAHDSNSIIPAFFAFKNCVTDRKTGKARYSDEEIAAFVKVLIAWYISEKTSSLSSQIEEKKKNIQALKKDEKANAKGIESEEKKIAGLKSSIEHFTEMFSLISDPSFETIDNLIAIYNNTEDPRHNSAKTIVKEVISNCYSDVDVPELEFTQFLLNIQQRAGMIYNLFCSPMAERDDYNEKNITKLSTEEGSEKN